MNSKIESKKLTSVSSIQENLSTIYSSVESPVFLHTNDMVNIYIRILLPEELISKQNNNNVLNLENKRGNKIFNKTINKLILSNLLKSNNHLGVGNNNLNILTILNKIYNKKVNIVPIFINNSAGGMNEFIIGHKSIYSPYKYNITMNKLNKYIISNKTIIKNNFINKNSLYNMLYYNIINNLFNNSKIENSFEDIKVNMLEPFNSLYNSVINSDGECLKNSSLNIDKNNMILSNLNNRYITGYSIHYSGKLPKADSSARTLKRNTVTGTLNYSSSKGSSASASSFAPNTTAVSGIGGSNTISKTLYYYNNNGLASTKTTIAHAPINH